MLSARLDILFFLGLFVFLCFFMFFCVWIALVFWGVFFFYYYYYFFFVVVDLVVGCCLNIQKFYKRINDLLWLQTRAIITNEA